VAHWAFRLCRPIRRLVTASQFAGAISTVAIKIMNGSWRPHPIFHYHDHPAAACSRSRSCSITASCLSTILAVFTKVMAHCSPLDEAVAGMAEVGNMDEAVVVAELERAFRENHAASNVEWRPARPDAEDILSEGGSGNKNSRTYYFGSSTITVGKIKEMVEKGYFLKGRAHTPGIEIVPEPDDDEAIVYEDFFVAGLCMPLHLALADILLHFQVQLHQLTPNAITQLSKYFWVVGSFEGVPLGSAFAKWYELYYQSKSVETLEGVESCNTDA
jgi:hypothetical protein